MHQLVECLLDAGFADAEQLQRPPAERVPLGEGRLDLDLPHPRHLARDPGHRDDALPAPAHVPARRRAQRIRERARRRDQPGLLAIPFGHRRAATGEPGLELGRQRRVDGRRLAKRGRDRFARQVVLRRTEPAGAHDQVAPLDRPADRVGGPAEVVADGRGVQKVDPQAGQPAGQIGRIRVDDLAEQELGADGQELSTQPSSPRTGWHAVCNLGDRLNETSQPFPSSPRSPAPVAGFCGFGRRIGWGYDTRRLRRAAYGERRRVRDRAWR